MKNYLAIADAIEAINFDAEAAYLSGFDDMLKLTKKLQNNFSKCESFQNKDIAELENYVKDFAQLAFDILRLNNILKAA